MCTASPLSFFALRRASGAPAYSAGRADCGGRAPDGLRRALPERLAARRLRRGDGRRPRRYAGSTRGQGLSLGEADKAVGT